MLIHGSPLGDAYMVLFGEVVACEIISTRKENIITKSLLLRPTKPMKKPKPGQFYMVWVPDYEEVPMSASGYFGGIIRITVAAAGETTRRIHELEEGEYLGLKGPLGNGIEVGKKRYLLVGGGYGVAPLIFAMREIKNAGGSSLLIIGARTADYLLFVEEGRELGEVMISTDDGSLGFKGTAADLAKIILEEEAFDEVLVCGPEPLLIKVAKMALENGIKCYVFAESYMKCGIGLCGSCTLGDSDILVCRDGPVIDGEIYLKALGYS